MKIVVFDQIGEVKFQKNRKSKSIRITVSPIDGVKVSIPTYLNYEFGENAVLQRLDWIRNEQKKIQEISKQKRIDESHFPLQTKFHIINITFSDINYVGISIKKSYIALLSVPNSFNLQTLENQKVIKELLNKVYLKEAKDFLPDKVLFYASNFSLKVNKITIRGQKSRWGSCSTTNNINLNFHLMKLPDELIDYVILHELAHVTEKNHGPNFWNLLNIYTEGKAKLLDKRLKLFNHYIY